MTPYGALKTAVYRKGRICTPREVQAELAAYLQQFKVVAKDPFTHKVIDWNDLYTREEWFAKVNSKKKARRKKEYDTVGGERLAIQEHAPDLDDTHNSDLDWIDELAARHEKEINENGYNGEW